jgi:hypothetical protein
MKNHHRSGGGRIAIYAAMALLAVSTISCSGLLDVSDPQAFGNEDLDDPKILQNVADGAEGALQQSYDDMIQITELLSDEMESSSTWIDWEDISEGRLRANWPSGGNFSGPQDGLLRARYAAQNAAERIKRVLGTAATQSPLLVQVMSVDGMADLLIGMGWCEGPLEVNSVASPDIEFFKQAITKFTAALTAAQALTDATARTNWTNFNRAGRARANLLAGNWDAALADAQAVPDGYIKWAIFSEGSGAQRSTTGEQFHQNRNRSGTLRRMYQPLVHSIDSVVSLKAYIRDWFDPTKDDPRMEVARKAGQLGVNNRFPYYGIAKYADRGADIRLLSKREMILIEAEVYMRKGDFATMTQKLNLLRATFSLPPRTVPANAADAEKAILQERFAELFVEGHRLQDINRFNLVTQIFGPGRAKKLPMSRNEIINNTNLGEGAGKCPAVS